MTRQSDNTPQTNLDERTALLNRLLKKYNLQSVKITSDMLRCAFIVLGVSYGLDEDDINSYMSIETKDILRFDIGMLSKVFDIPFPEGLEGDALVRTFKEQVMAGRHDLEAAKTHGKSQDTMSPDPKNPKPEQYKTLIGLLLQPDMSASINTFKLDIINDAIQKEIDENYLIELVKKGYEARELQSLITLYQLTHTQEKEKKRGVKH